MRVFGSALLLLALFAACGGGSGGLPELLFGLSGTVPASGAVDAPVDTPIAVTFTLPSKIGTLTGQTVDLLRDDGSPVPIEIVTQSFNTTNFQVRPLDDLAPNERYHLMLSGSIEAADGARLGADHEICFITANPVPTVRPDQVIDLGDRLQVPRYLARAIRTGDGRWLVIGGYSDPSAVTDTIEIWNPATRTFELHGTRLLVPRAEHTVSLLPGGQILIAGGVSSPGGPPLASTEFFEPTLGGIGQGPEMNDPRRWHAASTWRGGESVFITGGFTTSGDALTTGEYLEGDEWLRAIGQLPEPNAQHIQFTFDFDQIYIGVGNINGGAGRFDGFEIRQRYEGDARLRSQAARVDDDRLLVVAGDTRSIVVYDWSSNFAWGASDFLFDRRGAHSLTERDGTGRRFLAAGGFQISAPGQPALRSMEVIEYLPTGPFGTPDAAIWTVWNVELPVPFAGHVGFVESGGATVLAGGHGDGVGPHSRRVVMVLDAQSTPTPGCD